MSGMFGNSAMTYDHMRRRRVRMSWSMNGQQGLNGYAQYLAGYGDDATAASVSSMIGAETAGEMDSASGDGTIRAITVGVATGVLTFLINHWLQKTLK